MSLSERLLKYAETIITLSQSLEETKERAYAGYTRGSVSEQRTDYQVGREG